MYRLFLTLIIIVCGFRLNASELADKGDKAYQAEQYDQAIEYYNQSMDADGVSSDIYYNLGNAYYRSGEISKAILSYERALRIDPSNSDARANLDFVNARIIDKIGETGSFLYNTVEDIANMMSSDSWAYVALVLFILTICGIIAYILSDAVLIRKIGFFGGILTFILSVATMLFAIKAKSIATDESKAIITAETTILSTVPRAPLNHDEEAMLLHEGTKVRILRTIGLELDSTAQKWHEVEVDNKHRAWINDADIERIVLEKNVP